MIWLYNSKTLVGSYKRFEDVCDYFMRLEHFKTTDRNSFSEERWEFAYYSYEYLREIFGGIKRNVPSKMEREAYENELDVIEVCTGDPQMLRQIVLFPEVDVEELTRNWCFDYARAKNFALFELIEKNVSPEVVEPFDYRLFSLIR